MVRRCVASILLWCLVFRAIAWHLYRFCAALHLLSPNKGHHFVEHVHVGQLHDAEI